MRSRNCWWHLQATINCIPSTTEPLVHTLIQKYLRFRGAVGWWVGENTFRNTSGLGPGVVIRHSFQGHELSSDFIELAIAFNRALILDVCLVVISVYCVHVKEPSRVRAKVTWEVKWSCPGK